METERWAGSVGCGIVRGWTRRAIKSRVRERERYNNKIIFMSRKYIQATYIGAAMFKNKTNKQKQMYFCFYFLGVKVLQF